MCVNIGRRKSILFFLFYINKVWWQLPLFLFILSFTVTYIHNYIRTIHSSISIRRGLSPFPHCTCAQWGKTSLGCRAEIWTRACRTAGQHATNWAMLQPTLLRWFEILPEFSRDILHVHEKSKMRTQGRIEPAIFGTTWCQLSSEPLLHCILKEKITILYFESISCFLRKG